MARGRSPPLPPPLQIRHWLEGRIPYVLLELLLNEKLNLSHQNTLKFTILRSKNKNFLGRGHSAPQFDPQEKMTNPALCPAIKEKFLATPMIHYTSTFPSGTLYKSARQHQPQQFQQLCNIHRVSQSTRAKPDHSTFQNTTF